MDTPPIKSIFHIGAPKCGSSSLQTALTRKPILKSADTGWHFRYCALLPNTKQAAKIIHKDAKTGPVPYFASRDLSTVFGGPGAVDQSRVTKAHHFFNRCQYRKAIPIFSSEGYAANFMSAHDQKLLTALDARPLLVMFIRPQVEFFNSAWWQWHVWTDGLSFDQWRQQKTGMANWFHFIKRLAVLPFVSRLAVETMAGDVVGKFRRVIGAAEGPADGSNRTNTSLKTESIAFLLRNRQYRPGPHQSKADFILEQHAINRSGHKPWCLRPQDVQTILDQFRTSNLDLLKHVPEHVAEDIQNDPKWWTAEAYADRQVWDWTAPEVMAPRAGDADLRAHLDTFGPFGG